MALLIQPRFHNVLSSVNVIRLDFGSSFKTTLPVSTEKYGSKDSDMMKGSQPKIICYKDTLE